MMSNRYTRDRCPILLFCDEKPTGMTEQCIKQDEHCSIISGVWSTVGAGFLEFQVPLSIVFCVMICGLLSVRCVSFRYLFYIFDLCFLYCPL